MNRTPYVIAVCSHKGGTGRTTAALALAWHWGIGGLRVVLADADEARSAGLIALNDSGDCTWLNVKYLPGLPDSDGEKLDADVVLIDCPALLSPEAPPIVRRADGVVLTCLADPLSLRTVPSAAGVLAAARIHQPRLELLGVLIGIYNDQDPVQAQMLDRLRHMHGELLLEPPVPDELPIRNWALTPGSGLPRGLAADAFGAVSRRLRELVRRLSGVALMPAAERKD